MKKKTLILLIGVIVLLVLWAVSGYNGMVNAEVTVDQEWSNVETQYQRRNDLIGNLVATVKGYAEHEKTTLSEVIACTCSRHTNNYQCTRPHSRKNATVSAGTRGVVVGSESPFGIGRALSRTKSQSEFPRTTISTRRHGKPNTGSSSAIQRDGRSLQQENQEISKQYTCRYIWLRQKALLRCRP